ncbi:hypothetical protein BBJ28_00008313, partial [Nothophytophthora sp. Chile5]
MSLKPSPPKSYATFTSPANGSSRGNHPEPPIPAQHPQDAAWFGSRVLLGWVQPLMALAHRKRLDSEDVWPLRVPLQAELVSAEFAGAYERSKRSIPRAFFRMFGGRFVLTGAAFFVSMLCNLVGPVTLNRVISALTAMASDREAQSEPADSSSSWLWPLSFTSALSEVTFWVGFLFVSQVLQALVDNYASFSSEVIAIQFVGALKTMLYRKTLRLSARARQERSTGEITNMYTSDSDSVLQAAFLVHQAWLIPLQITIVSYMLYQVLDVAAFAGIGVIVLMLAVNNLVSRRMFRLQRQGRGCKETRMKKVTEVLKAIGIVKFNAWEDRFAETIARARATELDVLLQARITSSFGIFLMWGMPVFISIAAFGTFAVGLQRDLTPAIVFTSLALFQLIQIPLRMVMQIVTTLIQSVVALERVSSFMDLSEIASDNVLSITSPSAERYVARNIIAAIEDGQFAWDPSNSGGFELRHVNLSVKVGEFYVIHGPVGCGKTSLCAALLGEMEKRQGAVYLGGSVAYCSQQPWIQNMTVRDNILFGLPFDRNKYDKVVDACSLTVDLEALPARDHTEIGERGVNLSGGQQARVALARACYSDASVFVLDSPLAAVDTIVQNEIFLKCLVGLLRHKTILLVTHNPEIIASDFVSHAVTINKTGTLVETRRQLERSVVPSIVSPLAAQPYVRLPYTSTDSAQRSSNDEHPTFQDLKRVDEEELGLISPYKQTHIKDFHEPGADAVSTLSHGDGGGDKGEKGRLIREETRADGRVARHVFAAYYHAVGGLRIVSILLLSQMLWQGLQIGSDFWLSSWANDSVGREAVDANTEYRLAVYASLGLLSAAMVLIRTLLVTVYGLRAAKSLFDRMTRSLLHAPMRFFDATPIGRILTRYGGDVFVVDVRVPGTFGSLAANIFSVGCSAATAALVIRWKGLLLVPVAYLYVKVAAFYIRPARELERLAKTTQAPVLTHLSESVDGGTVLRAFGQRQIQRFFRLNNARLDQNSAVWFAKLSVSQWFSLRVQLVGSLLLLVVTSSLVLLRHQLSAAIIGLAFSYSLRVSANLEGIVRVLTQVETLMVSPERMQEYIDIEQEAPDRLPMVDPPAHPEWPSVGAVTFDK